LSSPRVAFFVPSLVFGGAERVAINLAEGFAARGVPTDLIAANGRGEFGRQIPAGVRLIDLKAARVLSSLPRLMAYLRRERPAAVITFMDHAGIAALWARRLSGTSARIICTVHTNLTQTAGNSPNIRSRFIPAMLRAFYPWADHIVAVSHGVANGLSLATGIPVSGVKVIYNPVITDNLLALAKEVPDHPWLAPGEPPVILGVGRLSKAKDFPNLIRAFAVVRRQQPARLIILGEGEERHTLTALIAELGLIDHVALPGFRENALAFMSRSAVFVLSSLREGLPTVLIEALAAGAAVVATDCPSGPREVLQDGKLGPLVPVGDSNALASAISRVLKEPAAKIGLEDLAPFTMRTSVDRYLALIENGG
jgi:glycosyltransferase involved in cell wall biosynthesis